MAGESSGTEPPEAAAARAAHSVRLLAWGLARLRDMGSLLVVTPILLAIGTEAVKGEGPPIMFFLLVAVAGLGLFAAVAIGGVCAWFIGVARLSRAPVGVVAARYFRSAWIWAVLAVAGAAALSAISTAGDRDLLLACAPVVLIAPLALLGTGLGLRALARERGEAGAATAAGRGLRWLGIAYGLSLLAAAALAAYYLTAPPRKLAGLPGRLGGLAALMIVLSWLPLVRFREAARSLAGGGHGASLPPAETPRSSLHEK